MKALSLSGRIIYSLPFAVFGLGHFANAQNMAAMVPVPGGAFWIYFTGAAMLAAAVSIIINKWVKLSGVLLAALMFIFAFTIFAPLVAKGDQMAFTGLMKDLSLGGAALFLAGTLGSESKSSAS